MARTVLSEIERSFALSQQRVKACAHLQENYTDEELSVGANEAHKVFRTTQDFFYYTSIMSAQAKSTPMENWFANLVGGKRVSSSDDCGDILVGDKHYELKVSTVQAVGTNLNIRQIRLYQDVDYYICAYIDEFDPEQRRVYKLTKEEMEEEVNLIGSYTHGVKSRGDGNVNKEWSITIPVFSETSVAAKRWDEKYLDATLTAAVS